MFRTSLACLVAIAVPAFAQPKAAELFPPDAATLRQIEAKTKELRDALKALPEETKEDVRADVEVYAKAAEWIVRHNEWLTKDSVKQTLEVLDAGLERAKHAKAGKTPWRDVRNKPVVRGYRSSVDGSVQPYSLAIPEGYDNKRLDVVLHGRDATLTEVKFIAQREAAKPAAKPVPFAVVEPYGRGNNAYRWAGETDVMQVCGQAQNALRPEHTILRGFSMGGAGAWHLGLHNPIPWSVVGPGAGFTTTRGYIKNLPAKLPDYQEACLHIYDAVDYAENAFNVPIVAYSGAKDPQKSAADNIEAALKGFQSPSPFTHLVAPDLEHRLPPEWQAKADAEYQKHLTKARSPFPARVRFVTYTTRYNDAGVALITALEKQYEKATFDCTKVEDAESKRDKVEIKTKNVRAFWWADLTPHSITVDGQQLPSVFKDLAGVVRTPVYVKENGRWTQQALSDWMNKPHKHGSNSRHLQGPIDDAFLERFVVVPPTGAGWHPEATKHAKASLERFGREWDKYFRGNLLVQEATLKPEYAPNLVLFGDPGSNPLIAKVVEKLPITWTKDKLIVNGVTYDPATHVPVLIYPNPFNRDSYVVLNSGYTFREADLKGTNALLYPRLGDWAVLKVTRTKEDPAAAEVVAAGLFDENWQFPKK